jgi:pimeloyl-ACP methyl ester carboxylesterase
MKKSNYADVQGLHMYYEIHGEGAPLVLIHGGGSTIESSFEHILPLLAKHYQIIAVEMQAHGRTKDNGQPLTFTKDADYIDGLLEHLNIPAAAILGFSNGGTTALQVAIRHPKRITKLVVVSGMSKRSGIADWMWEAFKHASLNNMPAELQNAYLKLNPGDTAGLQLMHDRDVERMRAFTDIPDEAIKAIQAPTLIINNDKDVITSEHALELSHLIPNATLIILPGVHGECLGEIASYKEGSIYPEITTKLVKQFHNNHEQKF